MHTLQVPLLPRVMSAKLLAKVPGTVAIWPYKMLCGKPSAVLACSARLALAMAIRPAHCGVDRLVPPMLSQLAVLLPGVITAVYWPVAGSALKATSATLRRSRLVRPGTLAVW